LTPTLKAATRVGDFFTAQLGGNHIYADERLIDHEVAAIHLKSHRVTDVGNICLP
jgi:hypothetical protein